MRIASIVAKKLISGGVPAMTCGEDEVLVPGPHVVVFVVGHRVEYEFNRVGGGVVRRSVSLVVGMERVCRWLLRDMVSACDVLGV
jgi:hypothetical protein